MPRTCPSDPAALEERWASRRRQWEELGRLSGLASCRRAFRARSDHGQRPVRDGRQARVRQPREHVLASVKVPPLVTAGSKDVATPPSVMAALHRRTAGSRYVVIEAARTTGRSNIRRS
jgi:pimeloyl-ACP methyl ester carboxylesterase